MSSDSPDYGWDAERVRNHTQRYANEMLEENERLRLVVEQQSARPRDDGQRPRSSISCRTSGASRRSTASSSTGSQPTPPRSTAPPPPRSPRTSDETDLAAVQLSSPLAELTEASAEGGRLLAYVYPGQVFVSAEPVEVTTVLGSCVAVCLWDGRLRLGGINHFLLPEGGRDDVSTRIGRPAVERLIEEVLKLGSREADLSAKLFGGAAVIEALCHGEDHLGARNVAVAGAVLAERRIPVVAKDVLGNRGRKVIFRTESGVALVRRL